VGYRSGQYAQKLLTSSVGTDAGLSGAANLRGGILAYVSGAGNCWAGWRWLRVRRGVFLGRVQLLRGLIE
jgi:hypothetical protein